MEGRRRELAVPSNALLEGQLIHNKLTLLVGQVYWLVVGHIGTPARLFEIFVVTSSTRVRDGHGGRHHHQQDSVQPEPILVIVLPQPARHFNGSDAPSTDLTFMHIFSVSEISTFASTETVVLEGRDGTIQVKGDHGCLRGQRGDDAESKDELPHLGGRERCLAGV
jgi:hypothetical protein